MKTNCRGLTLVETMIAITVIAVAFLGIIGSFQYVTTAIQFSRARTLANTLAQEKMQILRQISYPRLMITPAPSYYYVEGGYVPYDAIYYTPETILEGGITFKRFTFIQMVSESAGNLLYLGATPDTGMKAITVTVVWTQGTTEKKLQITSIYTNPNTIMSNATFSGTVYNAANSLPIGGAEVTVAEYLNWQAITSSSGTYTINLYPGSYSLTATARGFFSQSVMNSVAANQTITQNFYLTPMSSGTLTGTVWFNDHLVISQVCGSTANASGFKQEWVELFNPTTWTWQLSDGINPIIGLKYQSTDDDTPKIIALQYLNLSVAPKSYYLIANTNTITACGITRDADALWDPANDGYSNIIKCFEDDGAEKAGGGVGVYWVSNDNWIDRVGWDWNNGSKTAPIYETNGIDQNIGLETDEQYVRRCSTTGYVSGLGRCYDSDNNNTDFLDFRKPISVPPRNSSDIEPVVSGVPAIGALVSCEDGLSLATATYTRGDGSYSNPYYAEFRLVDVATGTWQVLVSSNIYCREISTVTVSAAGQIVGIPNSQTGPSWPYSGYYSVILSSQFAGGYISGKVVNALGQVISPGIKIESGSGSTYASATSGRYLLATATGSYTVTANPGQLNPQYVSQSIAGVEVYTGQITSNVNFILSRGGNFRGWVSRDGINPLPGIALDCIDANDVSRGQAVSGADGYFLITNITTGTYRIYPVLDSKETSSPSLISANVAYGQTLFIGTFTISGSMGKITGRVTTGGQPISTGVLIVASQSSFTNPPSLSSSTLTGPAYYTSNSYEDGTYTLEVRGSTTTPYNVRAYYPVFSGDTPTTMTGSYSNVWVNQGGITPNINFSW